MSPSHIDLYGLVTFMAPYPMKSYGFDGDDLSHAGSFTFRYIPRLRQDSAMMQESQCLDGRASELPILALFVHVCFDLLVSQGGGIHVRVH